MWQAKCKALDSNAHNLQLATLCADAETVALPLWRTAATP